MLHVFDEVEGERTYAGVRRRRRLFRFGLLILGF